MDFNIEEMRDFITISEGLCPKLIKEVVETEQEQPDPYLPIINDLRDAVFRLRSIMEMAGSDDYCHGVDMGMQRAAEIIENIIDRYA